MIRQHFPYTKWEDYHAGMYRQSDSFDEHIALSRELLSSPSDLRDGMQSVIESWPVSTAHQLTDTASNRRSWLGQAACCLVHGSTMWTTCQAWWLLTDKQREAANAVADEIIKNWEEGTEGAQASFGI